MPGDPGATVVTNACAYYTSRTRLRVQRAPGIPRSPLGGGRFHAPTRAHPRRENAELHLAVIASAAKQSIAFFAAPWIASLRSQ